MENKKLHILVQELAKQEKFADWGIATLSFCSDALGVAMKHYSNAMRNGDFAQMSYLYSHLEIRQSPELLIDDYNTSKYNYFIIVFLASYKNPNPSIEENCSTKIAQYAIGKDYHIVLKQRLNRILSYLKEQIPGTTGRCLTDSAPVMERALASACGLGAIGKNGFLISKNAGIKTLISEIILGIPKYSSLYINNIELDCTPIKNFAPFSLCGECHRCIDSCPTGALYAPGMIDSRRCISYHTIENRKNEFPATLPNPQKYIFGCDNCLNACPWNSRNIPGMDEFVNIHEGTIQLLENPQRFLKSVTKSQFSKIFRDSPIGRPGKDKIMNTLNSLK